MKPGFKRLAALTLVTLPLLSACGKDTPAAQTTAPAETSAVETTVAEMHKHDHEFKLADGSTAFVPSLWISYNGVKSSVLINSATATDASGKQTVLISGYDPLMNTSRLDPIAKTDALQELSLSFTAKASQVVIRRWPAAYIGKADKAEDFTQVRMQNNRFTVEAESLYEVKATFDRMEATYLIYVK